MLQRVPDWVPTWVDESLDTQWEVHYNLARLGTYDGLKAAWSALKARIQEDITNGLLFEITLNEMVHVHPKNVGFPHRVLTFYVMRDLAADMGW